MDDSKPDDYAIGHKRPPKEYQFKKGQKKPVGSGRRKHVKNSRTIITEMFDEVVRLNAKGKIKNLSKRELLIRSSYDKALKSPSVNETIRVIRLYEMMAPESMDPPLPIQVESIPGDEGL